MPAPDCPPLAFLKATQRTDGIPRRPQHLLERDGCPARGIDVTMKFHPHNQNGGDQMDITGTSLYLALLIAGFIGILWWAFGARRKRRFEKDGRIPFEETERPP